MQNTDFQRNSTYIQPVYGFDDPPSYKQLFGQEILDRYLSIISYHVSLNRHFYR